MQDVNVQLATACGHIVSEPTVSVYVQTGLTVRIT